MLIGDLLSVVFMIGGVFVMLFNKRIAVTGRKWDEGPGKEECVGKKYLNWLERIMIAIEGLLLFLLGLYKLLIAYALK